MKIVRYIYLALFILFQILRSEAQTHDLKFRLIPGLNGVSLGKITGMTRDKHGVMWFTDQTNRCVTRFDGNTMTRYQYDPKNLNTSGGKYPECILADSAGFLWIGYYGMGIDRFDPETNTYVHYQHKADDPETLSSDTISAILIDGFGNFWVGTNGGLDLLDQKTGKVIRYRHDAADSSSLSHNKVRALYEDRDGTLWVGTGMNWDTDNQGGLNRFNREQNNFTRYLHDPTNAHSLIDNKVRSIFEDNQGNFWIGTRNNGIHLLDKKSGRIDRIGTNTDGSKGLIRPPVTTAFDHVTFITQDAFGFLWFGTLSNGLIRYDPLTKTSVQYGSNNPASGFTDNTGWWCYASSDGPVWISTQESNLFQVELFTNNIPHYVIDSVAVIDVAEETDNILWLGTIDGLVRKDITTGSIQRFKHDPGNPRSISNNIVIGVVKDSDGMIWLATQNGLNKIDPNTHTIRRFMHDPNNTETISSNNVQLIFEDKDHKLWISTYGGGLNRMDRQTEKFVHYMNNPTDTTSLSENLVFGILQDDDGSIWVGTYSAGLNRLNIKTGKVKRYLHGMSVRNFFKDSKDVIWVNTDFGIFCYNKEADKFYQPDDVIAALKNIAVYTFTEDHQQNIWITTLGGLYKLDQKSRGLVRFGPESGISADILVGTIKVTGKGNVLFTTGFGYYLIDPNKLKTPTMVPKIHFKNLFVNGDLVKVGMNEVLTQPFFNTTEIKLSYDQNVFSIAFSAIDYSILATKSVYYKLEGYDKEWRQLTSDDQVYYFGVPPGRYRFMAKATNSSNGDWAHKNISIVISPPWWNTIWSYFMYGAVFTVSVYSAHRFQKERLVKKERERARLRELEQAREIEKAYTALKSTQTQLIQSEKMASLGELTAGIAHEIQNPLNFVNNFSEVNSELIDELEQEINKGDLTEIKKIAKNIRENEQKIVHHGKRADAIVKGMLQHSRAGSGVKEPTDINALADEYIRLAYHGWRAKDKSFNVDVKTDFDPSITSINVVPQDIGRVILNLTMNAFYAVTEKKNMDAEFVPTVTVNTKNAGDMVMISIKDNGNGVPQKVLDKIFQPFFTTKPAGQGTGLGLSLSYDIVKAHGGFLKVETSEGKGSEFIIALQAHN